MKTIQSLLGAASFTFIILCSSAANAADGAASKAAERPDQAFNREQAMQHRRDLHRWLVSEQVLEARMNPISVPVLRDEQLAIDTAQGEIPERVGLTKIVAKGVYMAGANPRGLAGRARAWYNGALKETDDGGYVYTSWVKSPGATAVRIHFKGFRLPDNASLYMYAEDGQVFGPYTGQGPNDDDDFWSHTVIGDEVGLQLRHQGPASDADLQGTYFEVSEVGHLRPRFLGGACGYNAECVVNLYCANDVNEPAVEDAKKAVALIQFISEPYIYICSGSLLADTDATSTKPYFLTANHCISTNAAASSLEAFFQFKQDTCSTDCSGIAIANHPQGLRVHGATVKSTSTTGDYTLLELNAPAPVGSTFLGWDANPVAFTNGQDLYRISHPSGAPQSYSEHVIDTAAGTCGVWPRGDWIYSQDAYGAIEGGSSGSPLVNAAGKVVGQLSGGCGWVDERGVCDFEHKRTVDGAFAAFYSNIKQFLDPESSQGFPSGAGCTSNSQCASGKCAGKRQKVCR